MVIVQHFPDSVKPYAEAETFPGRDFPTPDRCPHPGCRASGSLIRWGTYWRWVCRSVASVLASVARTYRLAGLRSQSAVG